MYIHRLDNGEKIYTFPLEIGTVAAISYKKTSSEVNLLYISIIRHIKIVIVNDIYFHLISSYFL